MIPKGLLPPRTELPDHPGIYFFDDAKGHLLYVGKAGSLKRRVSSYFTKAHDSRIAELVSRIAHIRFEETPTVIEALVAEAQAIRTFRPLFNIRETDDKSFPYLVITSEVYPRVLVMRGKDLAEEGIHPFQKTLTRAQKKKYLAVYGPYTSASLLKKALHLLRRALPWSDCLPPQPGKIPRACFHVHVKLCPGVCLGTISPKDYRKIIRQLMLFFEGKKGKTIASLRREMLRLAKAKRFEEAAEQRNRVFALQHIQDVALISQEDTEAFAEFPSPVFGRVEAYDISTISGTSAVGSMVVFQNGEPARASYRIFHIKTVSGANDYAMLEEVLRRRLARAKSSPQSWPIPEVFVIDGGQGQVAVAARLLKEEHIDRPLVGLAKGFDRKQDRLIFSSEASAAWREQAKSGKRILQQARDEAHRFAVRHHRMLRSKKIFR